MTDTKDRVRRLGPFTGTHLTVIIVTFAILLMLPIGAWAVTGSGVFITDGPSGTQARVNSAGQLLVGPAGLKTLISHGIRNDTTTFKKIFESPADKAIVVTSVTINTFVATAVGSGKYFSIAVSKTDASCSTVVRDSSGYTVANVNPPGVGVITLPFVPGFVIPPGRALCASNTTPASLIAEVYAYGYMVPGASVPVGAASPAGAAPAHQ